MAEPTGNREPTEKQKMLAGQLYRCEGPELESDQCRSSSFLKTYNATTADDVAKRGELLRKFFASFGDKSIVRPPFYCDYGYNIHIGSGVFFNFNCVILDVARVEIGDFCQIGPGVHIYAADHPRDPALRRAGLESGVPVSIGRNVWIGGGAMILPGITIADDVIIGAGSVVTHNVPAGLTVAGNPARPVNRKSGL